MGLFKKIYDNADTDVMLEDKAEYPRDFYTLRETGKRGVSFTGIKLYENESSRNNAHSRYSGSTGRSRLIRSYLTVKGFWVIYTINQSAWQGEKTLYEIDIIRTKADLNKLLNSNFDWLTQEHVDRVSTILEFSMAVDLDDEPS
jgi:hypothetical protein